jgi:hypothetical protein
MNNRKSFKIQIDPTPEQLDLVRRMGSKNKTESMAATEALAAVMVKPALQVIEQANVVANFFATVGYSSGSPSNLPLDDYFDIRARNFLNVWTQSQPGGTAMNFVQGATELFVQTYPLFSEITLNKNYLRAGNINHLAKNLNRLVQEVLLVQQTNAAFVIFNSLAGARIDGSSSTATTNLPIARTADAGVFQMDDFNQMMVGYDRATASWVGGTPVNEDRSITDLLGSPEWMGQVRGMSYQPQNTRAGTMDTNGATSLAAPESVRAQVWKAGDVPTFFDVVLHKVYEMGKGSTRSFNDIFDTAAGSTTYPAAGNGFGGAAGAAFAGATEEIVLGLNANMDDLIRLRMNEAGAEFSLVAEEYPTRADKTGLWGGLTEGYVSIESRAKVGLIM